jgi:hypothetical protein
MAVCFFFRRREFLFSLAKSKKSSRDDRQVFHWILTMDLSPRKRLQIHTAKIERERASLATENASFRNANRLLRLEITGLKASKSKLALSVRFSRAIGQCSHAAREPLKTDPMHESAARAPPCANRKRQNARPLSDAAKGLSMKHE